MRDTAYKLLPWGFGLLLGWFLFNPPTWLESLGPMAYAVNLALCTLLLVSAVGLIILSNLPQRVVLQPVGDEAVHDDLLPLSRRFEALGFRPVGPPVRVNVAPAATLLGFVHESEPAYGTAFRTGTLEAVCGYDVVSILHGVRGGLTTSANPAGAVLPAGPCGLRQVFTGEDIETLVRKHLDGIAFLRERGVHCRNVSADMFGRDFKAGLSYQRRVFLAAPLRSTIATLWRAATKRVPCVGTLREQKGTDRQIARILSG